MNNHKEKTVEIDINGTDFPKNDSDIHIDLDFGTMYPDTHDGLLIRNGIIIILCKEHDGPIVIDGKKYQLSQNNVIILPENHIIHHAGDVLEHCKSTVTVSMECILNMPSPIDTNIFGYSRYISAIKVDDEKWEDLQSYHRFLLKESKEQSKYQSEIIRSIFYAFILEITGEYEKTFQQNASSEIQSNSLTDRFFQLLAENYKRHRSIQFYADRLNLTPKYLSSVVKRITGRSMLDWIHEAVLIEARMLLRTTDFTVQQIAYALNFSSPSAFIQFFKKHTGTTPGKM